MLTLNQTIQSLAQRSQEIPGGNRENIYAITAYEKTGELTLRELRTRIKSHLLKGLRSHSKLASLSKMHERLVACAIEEVNQLEKRHQGLAMFMQFNAERLDTESAKDNHYDDDVLYKQIYTLFEVPDTHIYVGKIFDFSQFFRIARKTNAAIILQIDNQKARIYTLKGESFSLAGELENWHNQPTDKEYREVHKAGGNDQVFQGSGEENVARRQINANKAFLDEVGKEIEKLIQNDGWKSLLIYASKNYQPYIENWSERRFSAKVQLPPLVKYKLFQNKKELWINAEEKIAEHNNELVAERFLKDKSEFKHFVEGWKDVTDAVREYRVERLYITEKKNVSRAGFILKQILPYSYPVRDAKRVNNLLPWLTQGAIAGGGEIVFCKALNQYIEEPIAAKLRFVS